MMVPVLGGAATAAKMANKSRKVVKVAKETENTVKVVQSGTKILKEAENTEDIIKAGEKVIKSGENATSTSKLSMDLQFFAEKNTDTIGGKTIKGASKTNPLENIKFTDKVKAQMKQGDYHSFPESVEGFGANGKVTQITGGDVYAYSDNEIESTYDSWYSNKSISESVVQESRERAFEYITEYNKNNGDNYLYCIIFEVE